MPPRHLKGFLDIVRKRIAPRFDITPEILTHLRACNLGSGGMMHLFEDEWIARAPLPLMTDYISLALTILKNVKLPATGVTSPWETGEHNELRYAEAIGRAMYRVYRRKFCWYFLHWYEAGLPRWPSVTWQDRKLGLTVVHVAANTTDPFWGVQYQASRRTARRKADEAVDAMLAADGRSGRIQEVLTQGCPAVILTHWQSLFSNGSAAGLAGLDKLCKRIARTLGNEVAWMRCSDLAKTALQQ